MFLFKRSKPFPETQALFFVVEELEVIDLNAALASELEELRGIGPVLAKRIVAYRQKSGGYHRVEQLEKIYGLKAETLALIKDQICVDSLDVKARSRIGRSVKKNYEMVDLNLATASDLKALPGIGEKISKRIIKFRKAKGRIDRVGELQKIYGFSPENYLKARPYLKVAKRPKKQLVQLDLNTANEDQLRALPGIGEKLSLRIIKYRKSLGYFVSVDQLLSVYGLKKETFDAFRPLIKVSPAPEHLRQPLNQTNSWRLAGYPDISKELAEKIVKERLIKSGFSNWEELGEIPGVDKKVMSVLQSYFTL